jgi:hypothetical protein
MSDAGQEAGQQGSVGDLEIEQGRGNGFVSPISAMVLFNYWDVSRHQNQILQDVAKQGMGGAFPYLLPMHFPDFGKFERGEVKFSGNPYFEMFLYKMMMQRSTDSYLHSYLLKEPVLRREAVEDPNFVNCLGDTIDDPNTDEARDVKKFVNKLLSRSSR